MKHRLLSVLLLCCFALAGHSAINYSLNESFESGIPASWSQEVVNATTGGAWILDTVSTNPVGAYNGDYRVALRSPEGNVGYQVRLVSPAIDLSVVSNPQLSFAYAQPRKANRYSDTLSVYYRVSETASWVLLQKYTSYQNAWSLQTLLLPDACRSAACQFAFEAKENGGYGVILDYVRIFPESQCAQAAITGIVVSSNAAQISWETNPGRAYEIIVSASAISDLASYDTSSAVFYANNILNQTRQLVSNLSAATHYYVYLRTDCDDNESEHTEWVSSEFTTAIGLPYSPALTVIPSTWSQLVGAVDESVDGADLSANTSSSYKWQATTSTTSVFSKAHIYAYLYGSSPEWLITPDIDLSSVTADNVALSYRLAVTSGQTSKSASSALSSCAFSVFVSEDNGGTWSRIDKLLPADLTNNDGYLYHTLLTDYIGSSVRLAFVAECTSSSSAYFHLTDLSIDETELACLGLRNIQIKGKSDRIDLNFKKIGNGNPVIAVLSQSATFADTLQTLSVTSSSATFSGLTPNSIYYVSVRQDCDDAVPFVREIHTPCLPVRIAADGVWSEGFEDYTGSQYNVAGIVPDCWEAYSTGSMAPHVISSGDYLYKHSGTKALTFYGSGYCYAVLPPFANALDSMQISFYMQTESSTNGTMTLGYITEDDVNMNSFKPIATYANSSNSMSLRETDLSSVPAEANRLVFQWYYSAQYSCCIDDISLSFLPNCRKVQGLKVDAVTANSAQVIFKFNNVSQYEVLVVNKALVADSVATDAVVAFNSIVTTDTVAINTLNSATTYYAYVRSVCGADEVGAWSDAASFSTLCGQRSLPYYESFNAITSGIPLCWDNSEGTTTSSGYKWVSYSEGADGRGVRFNSYSNSSGNTNILATPAIILSQPATLSFYWKNPTGGAGEVLIAKLGDNQKSSLTTNLTAISSWTPYEIDLTAFTGDTVIIYFKGTSNYGNGDAYLYLDEIVVKAIPTCGKMGVISLQEATYNSATLRIPTTNASQYQVVIASEPISVDSIENSPLVIYNELVATTAPTISSLEANTAYYVYVRGYCGDEDYGEWSPVLSFKTLCTPQSPEELGVQNFNAPASADCWTFGFTTLGTSTSSAYAKRDSLRAYGGYLKLSKESVAYTKNAAGVDTVFNDGAYAVSPELAVDDIRNYQVTFDAATTSTAATNYKRLNIGILVNPNDLSGIEVLKTIDLDYAADSTALKSYTVAFTAYEGDYLGQLGKYIIFQLNEPAKHDSTNYVLIDNVVFEPASQCEQILEAKVDSIGVYGVKLSWENSGAQQYEVMLSLLNSRQPDTISAPLASQIVSTNAAVFTALESNTVYYAYVRAICGDNDMAKWSNSVSFRTAVGIPYVEPFSLTSLSDGWQSLYGNFSGDSILTSALTAPTGDYSWSTISAGLPTGMTAPAMGGYIDDYNSGYIWLISPVVDMTDVNAQYVELTFDMARSVTTSSTAKFYVLISEDGGMTWKKTNATRWESGGNYELNDIPTTTTNYAIGLSKYIGKKIAVAFYFQSPYGYTHVYQTIYVDNVSIHTFDAVCRGIESVSVAPAAESAKVKWEIEGTPVKATVEISESADFASYIDSVDVEDIYEHTFTGLTSNSQYYVRVKQLDCESAEWKTTSFKTECLPFVELPWSEDFESYTAGSSYSASNAMSVECWKNEHIEGEGTYLFYVYNSSYSSNGNSTKQLVLPDMKAGTKTLLTLPPFAIDEADAYQFMLDVYRNATGYPKEGLRIYASTSSVIDSSAVELAFISRNYSVADTAQNIIPAENASGWYTYALNIPFEGTAHIFIQGESQYGSSTYMDNFVLRHVPGCPDIHGLAVDSIVSDSARLFVDDLGAAGYHFIVASAEIGLDSLTDADVAKIVFNDTIVGDTTTFISGLQPATVYFVYARTICEDDKVGAWSAPVEFISACGVYTVEEGKPWKEGFENFATGSSTSSAPNCWALLNANDGNYPYIFVNTSSSYVHGGSKSLYFQSSSSRNGYAVFPEFNALNTLQIEFYYKHENMTSSGRLYLGYMTDIENDSTFVQIAEFNRSTSWAKAEASLNSIPDSVQGTARLAIKYGAQTQNYYMGIDDIKISAIPSCFSVTGVAVDSIGKDSAIVRFNSIEGATYDVAVASAELDMYHLSAADSAKIAFSVNAISDTALVANGLNASTTYYVYVRTNCTAASSEWTETVSFATECEAVVISNDSPWSEDFEAYSGYVSSYTGSGSNYGAYPFAAPCWKNEHIEGSGSYVFGIFAPSTTVQGNATHQLVLPDMTTGTMTLLALPQMTIDESNAYTFQMDMYRASASNYPTEGIRIFVSTKNFIDADATELGFIPRDFATAGTNVPAETAADWYTYEFTIPMSGDIYILLRGESKYGLSSYYDNFMVSKLPDCKKVSGLAVDSIAQHTAQLTFATNGAAQYEILVVSKPLVADTIAADALVAFRDTIIGDTLAIDTVAISGMAAATTYFAFVRALCDGNVMGAWSEAVSFVTQCDVMEVGDAGWSENFDELTAGIPTCWDNSEGTSTDAYKWSYYATGHEGKCLRFNSYSNSNGNTNILATPSFVLTKDAELSFWWKNPAGGAGEVLISKDGGTTKTSLKNNLTGVSSWTQYNIDLSAYTGDTVIIYFKGTSNWGNGDAYLYMDDIVLAALPDCRDIKDLSVTAIATSSAKASFAKTPSPQYDVVVTNAVINPDTLSLVADSLIAFRDTIDTTGVAISGLQPASDYYIYVRGLCSDTTASSWASAQFATRCLATIPFSEDFDDQLNRKPVYAGTSSYLIPSCWEEGYESTSDVSRIDDNTSYSTYAYSGTSALRLYSYYYYSSYSGLSDNASYVVLPEMDASLDTLQLTFKARAMYQGSSVNNYATSSYAHSIKIGTMTDPDDYSTFREIDTYVLAEVATTPSNADNYWEDVTIYLQGAQGKYIALASDFGKSNYVWIDDVEVSRAPDCLAPSAVKVAAGAHAADVQWSSIATEFEVALGAAGFALPDGADSIYVVTDTIGLHIADLEPSTEYELYVRALCGENVASDWTAVAPFSTTCVMPELAEYNFDDAQTRYLHHTDSIHYIDYANSTDYYNQENGTESDEIDNIYMENCWQAIGLTKTISGYNTYPYYRYSGVAGYYPIVIENKDSYIYSRSATGALEFFYSSGVNTPLIAVMPALEADRDSLQLEFWARPGYESNGSMTDASGSDARMLRVGLMTNPNDLSTFVPFETIRREALSGAASADPEGEAYWRRYRYDLAGTTAPFIAFVYDSTASNAFYVDDVRIKKIATCPEPAAPVVEDVTATTAVVRWDSLAPAYQVALIQGADTLKQMVVANDSLLLENLSAATSYIVRLRAFCSENDSSDWSAQVSFTTECLPIAALPWSEDFEQMPQGNETSDAPLCWDMINANQGAYPYIYVQTSYKHDGAQGLNFRSVQGSQSGYAILPAFEAPANALKITFWYKHESVTSSGDFDFGYMTDIASEATFVSLMTLPKITSWTSVTIMTNSIPAELAATARFVFKYGAANSTTWYYAAIDDILVEELNLSCLGVDSLSLTDMSANGVRLNFQFVDGLDHQAQVAISKEAAFDEATAISVATIDTTSYYFNLALENEATYYVYARQACDDNNFSEWKSVSFVTPYAIRYEAEFASTTLPDEWGRYAVKMDDVLKGSASLSSTTTSGWSLTAADTVLNNIHFRGNIFGTSWNYWVVSPSVSLAAPDGSNVQLRFDAGLTPYSSSASYTSKRNDGVDDRFVILVSTDNGATWHKVSEWNNAGTGDYVYNDIPETARTYYVDLSQYVGQTVRVAFYGESTLSNADNYFHFGNIIINHSVHPTYEGTVCEGDDYIGSEHGNSFYITSEQYHVGSNVFTEYRSAANGSGLPDSVLTLNLTVDAIQFFEETRYLCDGEHFSDTIAGRLFEFDAYVGMPDQVKYVPNEHGCEDVIELHLVVYPHQEVHIYDSVAQGSIYTWHDRILVSNTVETFDTVSVVTGCDSTTVLHLKVYILDGIEDVNMHQLQLTPNPVDVGQPALVLNDFSVDELMDANVEVFSAAGMLLYKQHGASLPFYIPGQSVSGMHYVRISIGKDVYISPLLVK